MLTPRRPKMIEVDLVNNLAMTTYMDYKAKNNRGEFELRRVGTFAELTEKDEDGKFLLPIDLQSYSDDKYDKQEYYQSKMGKCSHFAETLNSYLDSFLGLYFSDKNSAEYGERYANLQKLDFMNARNLLSEVLNNDQKFKQIDEINNKAGLKDFTKTFFNFITDRNKYTHGLLYLRYPDFMPVIQYENDNKKMEFAEINDGVIADYFETYEALNHILHKIYELELSDKNKKTPQN